MIKNLNIKTQHFRYVYQPIFAKKLSITPTTDYIKVLMSMNEIRSLNIDRRLIVPTGGETHVAVYDGEDKLAEVHTVCSKHDHYNRKLGRKIALGRALQMLKIEA